MELQKFLENENLTLTDFAEKSGLCKATVHNLLSQKRKLLSIETILRVEIATDNKVTIRDLFGLKRVSCLEKSINKKD